MSKNGFHVYPHTSAAALITGGERRRIKTKAFRLRRRSRPSRAQSCCLACQLCGFLCPKYGPASHPLPRAETLGPALRDPAPCVKEAGSLAGKQTNKQKQ